jgi:transcriptional regulator with XRE-family HTH domain
MDDEGQSMTTSRLYIWSLPHVSLSARSPSSRAASKPRSRASRILPNLSGTPAKNSPPLVRERAPQLSHTCVDPALESADDKGLPPVGRHQSSELDRFLGNRLKQLRLLSVLTRQQLARQLGVSTQQMQKYERGINQMSAGQLPVVAQALDVAIADLFDGYDSGAPLDPPVEPNTSRMLLNVMQSCLRLDPKRQDALMPGDGHGGLMPTGWIPG